VVAAVGNGTGSGLVCNRRRFLAHDIWSRCWWPAPWWPRSSCAGALRRTNLESHLLHRPQALEDLRKSSWVAFETLIDGPRMNGPCPRAQVDGIAIDYDDNRPGIAGVSRHGGWCGSRRAFDTLVPACQRHRVLPMDGCGHGPLDRTRRDFCEQELVKDALPCRGGRQSADHPRATAHAGWRRA